MSIVPYRDLPVNVRHQVNEVPVQEELYQGIYVVSLDRNDVACFVPAFERTAQNWPPILPGDLDTLPSAQEARLFSAALARHTVTPEAGRAGQQEAFEEREFDPRGYPESSPAAGVLFFVTPEEFAAFCRDLAEISEETPGIYGGLPLAEVRNRQVIRYLLSHVLHSPYYSEDDWEALARKTK